MLGQNCYSSLYETDVIYEEHRTDWLKQVSAMAITQWLQCDQTLPLSVKSWACETEEKSSR